MPKRKLLVKILTGPKQAYILARESVRKGCYAVLVAGGDGTINQVARALAGSKTVLGIIPAGTGNGFARGLGIPLNFEKACLIAGAGKISKIDLGTLGRERVFVSICGAGFDAWAARRANQMRWINRFSGFLRYLVSGILAGLEFKPQTLRVTVDSRIFEGPCLLVTVANGKQYGFGATIAPDASLNDGKLDIVLMPPANIMTMLRNSIRLYTKKPLISVTHLQGKKIKIQGIGGNEAPLHIDGESAGMSPVQISVKPGALSVLIP